MSTDTLFYKQWLCLLLLCIGLSACGNEPPDSGGRPNVPSPPASIPAPKPEPVAVSQETRDVYQWYCTQCHGAEGKGNGPNAVHLAVPPRNHTKADYLETRTDRQLFEAIKLGGLAVGRAPCMPAWVHTLDDATISSLVRYIRELCDCEAF